MTDQTGAYARVSTVSIDAWAGDVVMILMPAAWIDRIHGDDYSTISGRLAGYCGSGCFPSFPAAVADDAT
jgi:hypothetical protein